MKYSNIKRAYLAHTCDTSLSGARKLIVKHYDLSLNREHQTFTDLANPDPAECPEFHETLAGLAQACVEKEATNELIHSIIAGSGNVVNGWDDVAAPLASVVDSVVAGTDKAQKLSINSEERRSFLRSDSVNALSSVQSGETYTLSMILESFSSDGGTNIRIASNTFRYLDAQDDIVFSFSGEDLGDWNGFDENGTFPQLIWLTATASGDGDLDSGWNRVGFGTGGDVSGSFDAELVISNIQFEKGSYPTLRIPTTGSAVTRPAPLVPIDNFLPDTGYVGFVLNMVRSDNELGMIFGVTGDGSTIRSYLLLDNNQWVYRMFGSLGGQIEGISNPFTTWGNYDYKNIIAVGSYDTDNIYLYLCDTSGNLYAYESLHDINTVVKDISLGSFGSNLYTSQRFSNIQSGTDIIDTAEKAKNYIENLTRGSYNLLASEITHMNP